MFNVHAQGDKTGGVWPRFWSKKNNSWNLIGLKEKGEDKKLNKKNDETIVNLINHIMMKKISIIWNTFFITFSSTKPSLKQITKFLNRKRKQLLFVVITINTVYTIEQAAAHP